MAPSPCRRRGVIAATVTNLKGTAAEGRVGLADLVALAGAHAVRVTGGPDMLARIPVGRVVAGVGWLVVGGDRAV